MKKLMAAMTLALSLTLIPVKKSEAGVIIGGMYYLATQMDCGGVSFPEDIVPIGSSALLIAGGVATLKFSKGLGITMMVLDIDSLDQTLSQKFPFINNDEVFNQLTTIIKTVYKTNKRENEFVYVSIPEEKILDILSPLDLSEDELNLVIKDLSK